MPSSSHQQPRRRSSSSSRRRRTKYHKLASLNKLDAILEENTEAEDPSGHPSLSKAKDNDGDGDNEVANCIGKNRLGRKSRHGKTSSKRRRSKGEGYELMHQAKVKIICDLARSGGDATSSVIHKNLHTLSKYYDSSSFDPRRIALQEEICMAESSEFSSTELLILEGTWMSISKPNFQGCLGTNKDGDYLYTLGRMSFGK